MQFIVLLEKQIFFAMGAHNKLMFTPTFQVLSENFDCVLRLFTFLGGVQPPTNRLLIMIITVFIEFSLLFMYFKHQYHFLFLSLFLFVFTCVIVLIFRRLKCQFLLLVYLQIVLSYFASFCHHYFVHHDIRQKTIPPPSGQFPLKIFLRTTFRDRSHTGCQNDPTNYTQDNSP